MRVALALLALGLIASAQDGVPPGRHSLKTDEGMAYELAVPAPRSFAGHGRPSLIVILHGAGGTATGMAGALSFLVDRGFVVLAPKSAGAVWERTDLERVRVLVNDVVTRTGADPRRLHAAGFSNGGWNLAPVAFDPALAFLSATWVAAGYRDGRPPRGAAKRMGALALAGADDANRPAAEATPKRLEKLVRRTEVRLEPGLGHRWPRKLMPYYGYWLECLEGRFTAGHDLSFDWVGDPESARERCAAEKRGAFVYFWSDSPEESKATRKLQNEVFFHPRVRFFGGQLVPVKLARSAAADLLGELRVKSTPAIVTFDHRWKPKKTLQGKISARRLAAALRSRAKNKQMPR